MSDDTGQRVRFASGERAAFLEVYSAHARPVRRWVARFFKSPFEQEEAAQEVWLMVHRMQTSYDVNRGPLGPWLRVVASNRCRELLRAKGRRPDASVPLDDVDDALWLDSPLPDEQLMQAKARAVVQDFRKTLPKEEDVVLQRGLGDGLTNDEVAAELGVTQRQSKYLKKKLLAKVAASAALRALAKEWLS
ncbi:MAG: sigma-70 family RNA polymerase sigma factor [Myxococcaceae bacterium]|nr:sigma-70 family RNA polymerase sigma factor [Myxococcaceae bacterium]